MIQNYLIETKGATEKMIEHFFYPNAKASGNSM